VIAGGDDGVDVDQKFAYALGFYAVDACTLQSCSGYPPERPRFNPGRYVVIGEQADMVARFA